MNRLRRKQIELTRRSRKLLVQRMRLTLTGLVWGLRSVSL